MKTSIQCRELTTQGEFEAAYYVMRELYSDLDREKYFSFIAETLPHPNQLFGLFLDDTLVAVASTHRVLLIGGDRVLWIFHMVTSESYRSQGYGSRLIKFIEDYARKNGFHQFRVHSFNYRTRAHHFYRDLVDMVNLATVFGRRLDE